MTRDAAYWIQELELQPHPEGGYYRQTYRADTILAKQALPRDFTGPRPASTAIYFLLEGKDFSAFHRLRSDELWHFHLGAPLTVHVINPEGCYTKIPVGSNHDAGEAFQAVVRAGCWFASQVCDPSSYALVGCTVAPGFDFQDFELARRKELVAKYPQHRKLIEELTRN